MSEALLIHEIYASVQGESTWAGLPCTFVRTTGCNLRCRWCDTPQAFHGGQRMSRAEVLDKALSFETPLVELTGGEPLLQADVLPLMTELCDAGRTVLLETSGERDVTSVDERVHIIMDLKAPDSGECAANRFANLQHLRAGRDEVKVVVASRRDYDWMRDTIVEHRLAERGLTLLASCAWGELAPKDLVAWVLADKLDVRVQIQMHKVIWDPDAEGV